jgi:hypothetical protein
VFLKKQREEGDPSKHLVAGPRLGGEPAPTINKIIQEQFDGRGSSLSPPRAYAGVPIMPETSNGPLLRVVIDPQDGQTDLVIEDCQPSDQAAQRNSAEQLLDRHPH